MSESNDNQSDDDLEALYRRASSGDVSRPNESVRRAILRHAADRAAEFSAPEASAIPRLNRPAVIRHWRRPVAYGGVAAAALACLVILPHWVPPTAPPPTAPLRSMAPPAPAAAPPPTAPPKVEALTPGVDVSAETSSVRQLDQLSSNVGRAHDSRPSSAAAPAPAASGLADLSAAIGPAPAAAPALDAVNAVDAGSALRQAASVGDVARLQSLLGGRADVESRDASGRTPLMLAVLSDRMAAVEALLGGGANANAADANGTTPLQVALGHGRPDIAAALRRAGAR